MSVADLYPALSKAAIGWVLVLSGSAPRLTTIDVARPYITGQRPLRVGVVTHALRVRLTCPAGARVEFGPGEGKALTIAPRRSLVAGLAARGVIVVRTDAERVECRSPISVFSAAPDRSITVTSEGGSLAKGEFTGDFEIALGRDGRINVINLVPLEDYVAGVLKGEMPASFPRAALEAQAVAARSYALARLGVHAEDGFDLCAEVDCQVYRGRDAAAPQHREAARATAGQVLVYSGTIVRAYFSSDCGGATDAGTNVWWNCLLPYMEPVSDGPAANLDLETDAAVRDHLARRDDFCRGGPRHRWKTTLSRAQVQAALDRNLAKMLRQPGLTVGRLIDLRVGARSPSGRVQALVITTSTGEYTIHRNRIRWLFGDGGPSAGSLPSTRFVIDRVTDADGAPRAFVFRGGGHGHGLGLCQWGARGRALAGQSAREILAAYYMSAQVVRLSAD